jgi:hypothetical protein
LRKSYKRFLAYDTIAFHHCELIFHNFITKAIICHPDTLVTETRNHGIFPKTALHIGSARHGRMHRRVSQGEAIFGSDRVGGT